MIIKSLEELRVPDERTLSFTPMGLGIGVGMSPEGAAEFQQRVVARCQLAPQVPEGTRRSFDDLRAAYVHGLFCYQIFTMVNDSALLVLEQALRDRFIAYHGAHHGGVVTFVDQRTGTHHTAAAGNYHELREALRRNHRRRLLVGSGHSIDFNGMLKGLYDWARSLGLLRGQRNRAIEQAIKNLRNTAAHPIGYHLTTPIETARTLSDLAEIINHLWGVATPGGRLYPAPQRREVTAVMWNHDGTHLQMDLADRLTDTEESDHGMANCIIVRAVYSAAHGVADPGLGEFDSRHEVTHYPADLLWGPGTPADAATWHAEHQPQPDECDYLDRVFLIRYDPPGLHLPMRPSTTSALPPADQHGRWYAIKADHPSDAFHHVRNLIAGAGCARGGPCGQCHADTLHTGDYQAVLAAASDPTASAPMLPPDATTPRALPRVRVIT